MYIYMCVCVYVCVCIYVYMYICVYVYMCICIYVYMYITKRQEISPTNTNHRHYQNRSSMVNMMIDLKDWAKSKEFGSQKTWRNMWGSEDFTLHLLQFSKGWTWCPHLLLLYTPFHGGFLGGTPSSHPNFHATFHDINHPAIGVPPNLGNPHWIPFKSLWSLMNSGFHPRFFVQDTVAAGPLREPRCPATEPRHAPSLHRPGRGGTRNEADRSSLISWLSWDSCCITIIAGKKNITILWYLYSSVTYCNC